MFHQRARRREETLSQARICRLTHIGCNISLESPTNQQERIGRLDSVNFEWVVEERRKSIRRRPAVSTSESDPKVVEKTVAEVGRDVPVKQEWTGLFERVTVLQGGARSWERGRECR
ncbi:hypothetical protein KIPB_005655 [Kipferlia bialata]|uniref:Uncharacterized protein n=1 Tax=Kipferlia bialata TaxID=797122 RepID=A0A391NLX5_9EUKA|nr:hypothetical protein KIPB_005655 [Kipferlia bialata]|eukprot:g5655.t1